MSDDCQVLSDLYNRSLGASADQAFVDQCIKKTEKILTQPEDLHDKLWEHVQRTQVDVNSNRVRFMGTLREQISDLKFFLQQISADASLLKNTVQKIEVAQRLCSDASAQTPSEFSTIQQISVAHRNGQAVKEVLSQIGSWEIEMKKAHSLLEKEETYLEEVRKNVNTRKTPLGAHLPLLYVKLRQLYEWKYNATLQCQETEKMSSSQRLRPSSSLTRQFITAKLSAFFSPLENFVKRFQAYFKEILALLIIDWTKKASIYHYENPKGSLSRISWIDIYQGLFVTISKIIQIEQEKKYKKKKDVDSLSLFLGVGYFESVWKSLLDEIFNVEIGYESVIDVFELIDGPLGFGLLSWINKVLVPCIYENFSVFIIDRTHQRIKALIRANISADISPLNKYDVLSMAPADCLLLLSWMGSYQSKLTNIMTLRVDFSSPSEYEILSSTEKECLISRYVSVTKSVVSQWIQNLYENERQKIVTRTEPPDSDRNGRYMASTRGDLFLFTGQVIEAASRCQNDLVLTRLVRVILEETLPTFQNGLIALIKSEADKAFGPRSAENPRVAHEAPSTTLPGLEYYAIAMANSGLYWIEDLSELEKSLTTNDDQRSEDADSSENLPLSRYKRELSDSCKRAMDPFAGLVSHSLSLLTRSIFSCLSKVTSDFYTNKWYVTIAGQRPVDFVCATLDDYFSDFSGRFEKRLFDKFANQVFDELIIELLMLMTKKASKFRQDSIDELFIYDLSALKSICKRYGIIDDAEEDVSSLLALSSAYSIVSSSEKMILIAFLSMMKDYPEVTLEYLEAILMRRDDLDKKSTKLLVSSARETVRRQAKGKPKRPTIFSRIKL